MRRLTFKSVRVVFVASLGRGSMSVYVSPPCSARLSGHLRRDWFTSSLLGLQIPREPVGTRQEPMGGHAFTLEK